MSPQCPIVLVVEDDEAIRETISEILETEGYSVRSAANGQEALDVLPSLPRPCLILLDLMMPIMDGWTFLSNLEANPSHKEIPVVVVTAAGRAAAGISRPVLEKPVRLDSLLGVVKQYCT